LLVLAADAGLDPIAVHVDHGLRADSAADANVVAVAADALGVKWRSVRVTIDVGGNLEARARDARYRALHDARAELGATAILVAHTADDQAETVLLNLLRGSGSAGLAGMARRRGAIVRPLLHLRRAEVRAVVEARGFAVVEDPTNADQRWRRAWIRHEVLPMLERGADRDVVPILVRQSEVLRAESDLLDDLGDQLLARARTQDALAVDSGLRAQVLIDASLPIARRAVRRWLGSPPPSADEVERVLAVARGECVATELAGGRRVQRSGGRLRVGDPQELP
jgi:tRNA(Ile)-lysidine synthase